ncbi:syncytin-B-like [Girardinichthys multiradiatus]|uniref:syncytin-B-like n=1 Tax=Girardinichthys multiradiatus TaxID=208333 RepID=UPI001FAC5C2D|nr:syncytin-B-like [Girardinichthys multiradiatus]
MLALHMTSPKHCSTLSDLFPPANNHTIPPVFTPRTGNYTWLTRRNYSFVGHMSKSWCPDTINVTTWDNASSLLHACADLFWFCGGKTLFNYLPSSWSGTCTLVRLALPVVLLGHLPTSPSSILRHKRAVDFSFRHNDPTYFDAIGVPCGVPYEYKLASPIANGFESIFLWITPKKNVDRINYVHYNIQRLVNITRDVIVGVTDQLSSSSLMSWQNRMALDMLLAEKGGIFAMFGSLCCTFIPNNTAPDGSVAKALDELRTLAHHMTEDSGVDSLPDWFADTIGKWKDFIITGMTSFAIFAGILICCGCCAIPCLRTLINRLITTALSKEDSSRSYQKPLRTGVQEPMDCSDESDSDSHDDDAF